MVTTKELLDHRRKVLGQLRFQIRDELRVFDMYGMNAFFLQFEESMMTLFAQAHLKLQGVNMPYDAGSSDALEALTKES
ncbi:MAG: hypothetical protein TUN42_04170 [Dehalogenimonas sp.]